MPLRRRLLTSALALPVVVTGFALPATAHADTGSGAATSSHAVALRFASGAGTAAAAAARNFVKNASFEKPVITDDSFAFRRTIPSWETVAPSGPIEIDSGALGPARDGEQYIELDSTKSATVTQTIVVPKAGVQYSLTLSAAARPGTDATENAFSVTVAGNTLGGSLDGTGQTSLVWRDTVAIPFTPTTTSFTLSFANTGPSNGIGIEIDNVAIVRG